MSSDKGAMDVYSAGSFPDIENALELNLILKQNPDVKRVLYHKMSEHDRHLGITIKMELPGDPCQPSRQEGVLYQRDDAL